MSKEALEKACLLAHKMGNVFIATADDKGTPHISVVQPVGLDAQGRFQLMGWLCQYTTANLEKNPGVSVLIWEPKEDVGYQLIGKMEDMREIAVLDGYVPFIEKNYPLPQVERKISVRVDKILGFERKPHIDVEV